MDGSHQCGREVAKFAAAIVAVCQVRWTRRRSRAAYRTQSDQMAVGRVGRKGFLTGIRRPLMLGVLTVSLCIGGCFQNYVDVRTPTAGTSGVSKHDEEFVVRSVKRDDRFITHYGRVDEENTVTMQDSDDGSHRISDDCDALQVLSPLASWGGSGPAIPLDQLDELAGAIRTLGKLGPDALLTLKCASSETGMTLYTTVLERERTLESRQAWWLEVAPNDVVGFRRENHSIRGAGIVLGVVALVSAVGCGLGHALMDEHQGATEACFWGSLGTVGAMLGLVALDPSFASTAEVGPIPRDPS